MRIKGYSDYLLCFVSIIRVVGGDVEHDPPSRSPHQRLLGMHPHLPAVCLLGCGHGGHSAVHGGTVRFPAHAQASLVSVRAGVRKGASKSNFCFV